MYVGYTCLTNCMVFWEIRKIDQFSLFSRFIHLFLSLSSFLTLNLTLSRSHALSTNLNLARSQAVPLNFNLSPWTPVPSQHNRVLLYTNFDIKMAFFVLCLSLSPYVIANYILFAFLSILNLRVFFLIRPTDRPSLKCMPNPLLCIIRL